MALWGQLAGFSGWLANPWLLVAGTAAVALPILIHLLNRRRFQVVEWAAMDFLLEADRTNRRRIRLQHLILLILRSLAVILIGLLLARPFVPTSLTAGLVGATQFERIIILDDSLSMTARAANESAWDVARRSATELIRQLSEQRGENSTCTLLVTSQPGHPLVSGMPLTKAGVDELLSRIERLEAGDGVAKWNEALTTLAESLSTQSAVASRIVYVVTDLQRVDWQAGESRSGGGRGEASLSATTVLRKLSERVQQCYLVDAGSETDGNLTVTPIQAEGPLASGVRAALDVTVKNQGTAPAGKLTIKLTVEDGLPTLETIDGLKPGDSTTVRFHPTFFLEEDLADEKIPAKSEPRRVRVDLQANSPSEDRLAGDSTAYFPAQVTRGIRALLIDGDPSSEFGRAESFYLSRALSPSGPIRSGIVPEVITENDLDSVKLDDYQVVFLLNTYRLGDQANENLGRLEQWVARGGNLVLLPGDLVDLSFFNGQLWREGHGLSPLKLEAIRGDEQHMSWGSLKFDSTTGSLKQFSGSDNPLLDQVKIFRWWQASDPLAKVDSAVTVLAKLNDTASSPAIAEKTWGAGKVVAFTIPADADWHNWPSHPSFVLLFQDLVHSLTGDDQSRGQLRVGDSLHQPVDLTRYERQAALTGPQLLNTTLQAAPTTTAASSPDNLAVWQVAHPTDNLGFYEVTLTRRDSSKDLFLFAANADENEGNLQRADHSLLEREFAGTNIRLLSAGQIDSLSGSAPRAELWWYLGWLLVAVLASEQLLGWQFGRDRE